MDNLARWAGYPGMAGGSVGVFSVEPAALRAVCVYASATGRLTSDASATSDPLAPFWMVAAVAWFLGNIGFAVAIIRGGGLSGMGGWLLLAGGGTRPGVPGVPAAS